MMRRSLLGAILFAVLMVAGAPAFAAPETVTRETTGYGDSYQSATAAALLEAVRQVRGAEVSSSPERVLEFQRWAEQDASTTTGSVKTQDAVSAQALGWISSYEVLSVREPAEKGGDWRVTVRANVPVPVSADPEDNRPTLVILPIRFLRPVVGSDQAGEVTLPSEVAAGLQEGIQTRLVQSGRFSVLNRDFSSGVVGENRLLASGAVPPEEAAKFGQLSGADRVLTGVVAQLGNEKPGPYGLAPKVRFEFSWQLIDAPTQRILWSDKLIRVTDVGYDERTRDLVDRLAGDAVGSLLDSQFPTRILDITGSGEIFLNQGKARLQVGQTLAVLEQGRDVKDPETGRTLTLDGRQVAILEVLRTEADYSVASLKEGDPEALQTGQRLKRLEAPDRQEGREIRSTSGSGEAPFEW